MKPKAVYNPLPPERQFVSREDFEGFHQDRLNKIREIRAINKSRKVRTNLCLMRDSDELKATLKSRLAKMGFPKKNTNKFHTDTFTRLARQTGIPSLTISDYFNHNRYIWNEAKGKGMPYISAMQLFMLCIFAGVKVSLKIELEPLEYEIAE